MYPMDPYGLQPTSDGLQPNSDGLTKQRKDLRTPQREDPLHLTAPNIFVLACFLSRIVCPINTLHSEDRASLRDTS